MIITSILIIKINYDVLYNYNFSITEEGLHPEKFGLCDTSSTPSLGYMEVVPFRDATTLLPIIQAHVQLGTIIHSDEWRAYNNMASLPSVSGHSTVNHSLQFVDPATDTHTQHMESYWARVKHKFKRMKGCHAIELTSYLDEFMWCEKFSKTASAAFTNICSDISVFYIPSIDTVSFHPHLLEHFHLYTTLFIYSYYSHSYILHTFLLTLVLL